MPGVQVPHRPPFPKCSDRKRCVNRRKRLQYTDAVNTDRPVTTLLGEWRNGDNDAGRELIVLMQPELRRMAAHYMRGERSGHTLQPTALVNSLYLELMGGTPVAWQDRAHFLAVASTLLRRVLVEHARRRNAAKRGGGAASGELDDRAGAVEPPDEQVLDIHHALEELEAMDARAGKVIELRYYGGLTETETAEVLGISLSTLRRDWEFSRAWLAGRLKAPP